jgi:hypothetical protein
MQPNSPPPCTLGGFFFIVLERSGLCRALQRRRSAQISRNRKFGESGDRLSYAWNSYSNCVGGDVASTHMCYRNKSGGGAEGLAAGSEFQIRGEAPGSLEDKLGVALASPREQYLAAVLNIPTKARPHDAARRPRAAMPARPPLTKSSSQDIRHG